MSIKRISCKVGIFARKVRKSFYLASHGIGKAPFPKMVALPLTAQCNYRCNFCEIVGVTHLLKERGSSYFANTMSLEHLRLFSDFIRSARKFDIGGVTGFGEPLLSKHFDQQMREIRRLNDHSKIHLTTNGSLLSRERTDLLISLAPLGVTFSVHAASEKTYRKVMGSEYAKVIENIRYFCEQARMNGKITTTINFGLGKFNLAEAEDMVRLAKELGIDTVYIYPYYKSPNKFMEDVSLYSKPDTANKAIDAAYQTARKIGQRIVPDTPPYIRSDIRPQLSTQLYQGGCQFPFQNFILKADPYHNNKVAFCVCNRIILFLFDLEKMITSRDLVWMWNHPVLRAMRFPRKRIPDICTFCKDPETPRLRSLHHEEYKIRRDTVIRNTLSGFQKQKMSPNGSIELLSENMFSIP